MKTIRLEKSTWSVDYATLLGQPGEFGSVFAGAGLDGAPVAIKVLHSHLGNDGHRELDVARALVGRPTKHIVPILDSGIDIDLGESCIIMSRADKSLRDDISDIGLRDDQVTEIMLHIALGLSQAGDWIHRDLKPENVLWCCNQWQIADFGVARAAMAATSAGTLRDVLSAPYAAPEQWNSEHATHATDIYALGCIGTELLAGKPPFLGPTRADFAFQHRNELPLLQIGSPRLRSLLSRMLAKPPVARPSIDQVVNELTSIRNEGRSRGPGGKRLAEVSARVAEETAKREAMRLAAQANAEERERLADHAVAVMRGLV
jgi:serine/threonine-protein kinase